MAADFILVQTIFAETRESDAWHLSKTVMSRKGNSKILTTHGRATGLGGKGARLHGDWLLKGFIKPPKF